MVLLVMSRKKLWSSMKPLTQKLWVNKMCISLMYYNHMASFQQCSLIQTYPFFIVGLLFLWNRIFLHFGWVSYLRKFFPCIWILQTSKLIPIKLYIPTCICIPQDMNGERSSDSFYVMKILFYIHELHFNLLKPIF